MIYRSEHPKPQFMRENWLNLNGIWQYEADKGSSGKERQLYKNGIALKGTINVPFCPQSALSGINERDFLPAVWYKRTVKLTKEQLKGRVMLHFGAVDYAASVYVNGDLCGCHKGGYTSFSFDITEKLAAGENTICLCAEDDERSRLIPSGKQSPRYSSYGCFYTRTTGIWQTVWLEFVPNTHIKSVKLLTDARSAVLTVDASLCGKGTLKAQVYFEVRFCGNASVEDAGGNAVLTVSLSEKHLWEVGQGGLYDLVLSFGEDVVRSYFGLRSIKYEDYKFFLNDRPVFQRLVLDQGFYPDGVYTAPSDAELEADIDRSMAMGFNGARLHQKVFEERFLYHADRKGYLVWAEYPSWGLDISFEDSIYAVLPEWLEVLNRDINHPSVIGWCPLNETWDYDGRKQQDGVCELLYKVTKSVDPTRPVIDTSGGYHVMQDVYDVHDYEQNPKVFASHYSGLPETYREPFPRYEHYDGKQPFFVSEYGGILWSDKAGWGYGDAPKTKEEFLKRLKGLTDALLDNPKIFGLCYTQLTDVEQEQNGLYTYDRKPKFDSSLIRQIFSRKAKAEE